MKYWYYYLHTNGDLISKNPVVVDADPQYFDSPFVKRWWNVDLQNRGSMWAFILEALASGAKINRIKELAVHWNLTIEDSLEMIKRVQPTNEQTAGLNIFIEKIFNMKLNDYWEMIVNKTNETQ